MSVDYYIRLEQARGPRPSRQILAALARALMLSRDERDYLFRIAGEAPPQTAGPNREVGHAVRYLLDALTEVPAYVVDAQYDVLAWNALAVHFIGDMSAVAEDHRNMIRWIFRRPGTDAVWNDADSVRFARDTVADLRAAYARYRGDPGLGRLVTEMLGVSPLFAEMWAAHEVAERRRIVKRVEHPSLGALEFECQVLHVPDTDQRIIVYCPPPDSPTQATFQRLATQTAGTGPAHSP
jgi:PAS domain-containing protein